MEQAFGFMRSSNRSPHPNQSARVFSDFVGFGNKYNPLSRSGLPQLR